MMEKSSLEFEEFRKYVRERMAWQLTNLFFRSIRTKNPLFKREVIGLMKILSLQTHSPPAKKLYDRFVTRMQEEVRKIEQDMEKMPPEELKRIIKTCLIEFEDWLAEKIIERRRRTEKEVYT